MDLALVVTVAAAWLAVGATVGLLEARRGGWRLGWVVSAVLGPLAIPLALERGRTPLPAPQVVAPGRGGSGDVDVLVGIDGSEASIAAARLATRLVGGGVGRFALATVLDVDTAAPHADSVLYPDPWPEEQRARELLARLCDEVRQGDGVEPAAVVLAGEPASALGDYAAAEGYEVVVIGSRGSGLSKLLLGSTASKLAADTRTPVLIVPAEGPARDSRDRPPAG